MEFLSHPGIIGGIAGGLAVAVYAIVQPRKNCPQCQQLLPLVRAPKSTREAAMGGWHCPNCNTQIDRKGRLLRE